MLAATEEQESAPTQAVRMPGTEGRLDGERSLSAGCSVSARSTIHATRPLGLPANCPGLRVVAVGADVGLVYRTDAAHCRLATEPCRSLGPGEDPARAETHWGTRPRKEVVRSKNPCRCSDRSRYLANRLVLYQANPQLARRQVTMQD